MHENMYTAKPNRQAGCAAENNLFYKYVIKRQYDEDTLRVQTSVALDVSAAVLMHNIALFSPLFKIFVIVLQVVQKLNRVTALEYLRIAQVGNLCCLS